MSKLLTFILWLILLIFVNTVSPTTTLAIISFFIIIFACFLGTSFTLFRHIKLNILLSLLLTILPVLAFFNVFTFFNISLLTILFLSLYFLIK